MREWGEGVVYEVSAVGSEGSWQSIYSAESAVADHIARTVR